METHISMKTQTIKTKERKPYLNSPAIPNLAAIKTKQKSTWESGDFGEIAHSIQNFAEEFMDRLTMRRGMRVLDVACGTGNLAVIAAKCGCDVSGIDIASNLIAQARARAAREGLDIVFEEGDAEALPFENDRFDLVVSMFGVMFTPQPAVAAEELRRVTKPGGMIALANWTKEGFIGEMFGIFKAHLPPPPAGVPSPMEWGHEEIVQKRLQPGFTNLCLTRRVAPMWYPFPPADTVDYFRKYYGPTLRAFESLPSSGQEALWCDLVALQTRHNIAKDSGTTEVPAEYLEIIATKN
jgi:SAM-dependent methyltransferase